MPLVFEMTWIVGIFPQTCHNGLAGLSKSSVQIRLNLMILVHFGIDS